MRTSRILSVISGLIACLLCTPAPAQYFQQSPPANQSTTFQTQKVEANQKNTREQTALSEKIDALTKRLEEKNQDTGTEKSIDELRETVNSLKEEVKTLKAKQTESKSAPATLTPEQQAKKAELVAELEKIHRKRASLQKAIQDGLDPALIKDSLDRMDEQANNLTAEIDSIKPVEAQQQPTVGELWKTVNDLQQQVKQANEQAANAPKAAPSAATSSTWIKVRALLQSWVVFTKDDAPNKDSWDTDFYMRRIRLMFLGQLNDKVNFFIETDSPNFGKKGDFTINAFIQDAWVEYNVTKALQINVGMLLVPFSHNGMESAAALHSIDYHTGLLRYPTGSNKVWRDFGLMVRGILFENQFEYRLAVLNGVHGSVDATTPTNMKKNDPRNPHDIPRVIAHVVYNVFDPEGGPAVGGYFYKSINLEKKDALLISPKKILSFGLSLDWQKALNVRFKESSTDDAKNNLYAIEKRGDYFAIAADAFLDFPLTGEKTIGIVGQIGFFYYDHGDRRAYSNGVARSFYATDSKYTGEYTGYGMLSEFGIRYHEYELLAGLDFYQATKSDKDAGDLLSVYGGFNWWWFGHATSIKTQAGGAKRNGGDWGFEGKVQAQFFF